MVGKSIAHFEITAKIGEGGMGEVYQATDTKLNRQVALKILPRSFAQDPQRMGRFQREAQVLASLNHPNIAAIHGLEDADGQKALVSTAGLINCNPMETARDVACKSTERLSPSSIQVLRFMLLDLKSLHIETYSWAALEGRRDKRVNVFLTHPGTTVTSKPVGTMLEPVGNCQCNSDVPSISIYLGDEGGTEDRD